MDSKLESAKNLFGVLDDINSIPDSFFKAASGKAMIGGLIDNVNMKEMAEEQKNEFLRQGMSYEQVVMACAELVREVNEMLDTFEEQDMLSEKKVFFKELFGRFNELPELILKDYPRYDQEIKIQKIHPDAQLPVYAHETDAGADILAIEDTTIQPGATMLVRTGLKAIIPPGWMLSARPRGGNSLKTKMRIANSPGTIDANYTDELLILCDNIGTEPLIIKKGTRPAQILLEKVYKASFVEIDDIDVTTINRANEKGEQKLSSTGE